MVAVACFLPGRGKDLSTLRYYDVESSGEVEFILNFVTNVKVCGRLNEREVEKKLTVFTTLKALIQGAEILV